MEHSEEEVITRFNDMDECTDFDDDNDANYKIIFDFVMDTISGVERSAIQSCKGEENKREFIEIAYTTYEMYAGEVEEDNVFNCIKKSVTDLKEMVKLVRKLHEKSFVPHISEEAISETLKKALYEYTFMFDEFDKIMVKKLSIIEIV